MKNIIIVESPSKSKTIEGYIGSDYKVMSSVGHIRDLATSGKDGLGIDVENGFTPNYVNIRGKSKIINELKKACKGNKVYLATDPDREGEAISYHLATVLGLDVHDLNRIEFHEITEPAVKDAFNHVRSIDLDLVNSQETRRMLDRIIGFKVSKLLQKKIKSKSAGRVQSVALKIVCDLEKEILSFVPEAYFEIHGVKDFMKLDLKTYKNEKITKITSKEFADEIYESLDECFTLIDIKEKKTKRESKPPFTTSTMSQAAANQLNFHAKKTMSVAQALYEGKQIGDKLQGLITYMRTDSTRLSDVFTKEANKFIQKNFGEEYLGAAKNKAQKLAQDAHEAIRPTSIMRTPEDVSRYLNLDELKLYTLIYNRTIASLMSPSRFMNTTYTFENNLTTFATHGQRLLFDGYLLVFGKGDDDKNNLLPKIEIGEKIKADSITLDELFTKPKSRYTEASIIKDMEDKGIGRPSTYAQTISTLLDRGYCTIEKKKIIPTEQGMLTSEKLDEFFSPIVNVDYTAKMEQELDLISKGEAKEIDALTSFWDFFIPIFEYASTNMKTIPPKKTGEKCPKCGGDLVIRKGKYGEFVACSNFPTCKYIKDDRPEPVDTGIVCPKCGKGHIVEKVATRGRNKGNTFYACSEYPKCKNIYNDKPTNEVCPKCGAIMLEDKDGHLYCSEKCDEKEKNTLDVLCPNCKTGHFVKKTATRGKNAGLTFYACDNYPKCKTAFNFEPTNEICEVCGSMLLKDKDKLICSNENCPTNKTEDKE